MWDILYEARLVSLFSTPSGSFLLFPFVVGFFFNSSINKPFRLFSLAEMLL